MCEFESDPQGAERGRSVRSHLTDRVAAQLSGRLPGQPNLAPPLAARSPSCCRRNATRPAQPLSQKGRRSL